MTEADLRTAGDFGEMRPVCDATIALPSVIIQLKAHPVAAAQEHLLVPCRHHEEDLN